jgi:hypothetical protein
LVLVTLLCLLLTRNLSNNERLGWQPFHLLGTAP